MAAQLPQWLSLQPAGTPRFPHPCVASRRLGTCPLACSGTRSLFLVHMSVQSLMCPWVLLQALRELDQTGGTPFLRGGPACGDAHLILGSPDFSFLASYGAERHRSAPMSCSTAAGRTPSPAPHDIDVLGWA